VPLRRVEGEHSVGVACGQPLSVGGTPDVGGFPMVRRPLRSDRRNGGEFRDDNAAGRVCGPGIGWFVGARDEPIGRARHPEPGWNLEGRDPGGPIGPNPYRVPEHNGANFADNLIEFTYVVKEQQGTRFAGETEGKFTQTFIGMLKPPDYRSGIFVDIDGQYDFTLRDENTIDMCYWHQYPASKVVACWTLTRQP
jgi:hypothetical protein